jgi:hypothetical protein
MRPLLILLVAAACSSLDGAFGGDGRTSTPVDAGADSTGATDAAEGHDGAAVSAPDSAADSRETSDLTGGDAGADAAEEAPGSLEACRAGSGPQSCCRYDLDRASWVLVPEPCSLACAQDQECPVGWLEVRPYAWGWLEDAPCECVSPTAGDCQEGQTVWVGPDEECPPDTNRCPRAWPDRGEAECSVCPCQDRRSADMPLDGTLYCPAGEDWSGCPCGGREDCCGERLGEGLSCGEDGLWHPFNDCPCMPEEFCGPEWGEFEQGSCDQPD